MKRAGNFLETFGNFLETFGNFLETFCPFQIVETSLPYFNDPNGADMGAAEEPGQMVTMVGAAEDPGQVVKMDAIWQAPMGTKVKAMHATIEKAM